MSPINGWAFNLGTILKFNTTTTTTAAPIYFVHCVSKYNVTCQAGCLHPQVKIKEEAYYNSLYIMGTTAYASFLSFT
jgi:hypothetical protein